MTTTSKTPKQKKASSPPKALGKRQKIILGIGIAVLLVICAILLYFALEKKREKERYRVHYPELIMEYSAEYELDPYLVAAVIYVESRNKPDAVSPKGAIGLMQVMPSTGEWIAEKLSIPLGEIELTNPNMNVEMGCWYLRFLLDRFPVQDTAVAAYNAGQGNVREWLDDKAFSENAEDLHSIPFPETEQYVVKVNNAYDKIKEYYPEEFGLPKEG